MDQKKTEGEMPKRLLSLDALRGFDMWFITGGAIFVSALCAALGHGDCWLARQMHHVPWEGLAHHDTIFPLFLFLAGVSWPFSLASQVARGRTMREIHLKILRRALTLFAFGVLVGGILGLKATFRIPSVLGFIGLSWGVAATCFLHLKKTSVRASLAGALLLGYWAVLHFCAAPGAPAGADTYSKMGNIVSWIDRTVMPNYILAKGVYDPESLFSLAGGVAMALLGMLAGSVLKRDDLTPGRKAGTLALMAAGLFCTDLLFIYGLGDTIVKALWTPSFVLSAATYSAAMLALFFWIIDVKGWTRWAFYFRVIGMNSITIYLFQFMVGFGQAKGFFFAGLSRAVPPDWDRVVMAAGQLVLVWAFLYFLYRKKIFLKV